MKTYDRDASSCAATPGRAYDYGGRADHDPHKCAVRSAKRLIDEVERQCPLPEKPKATPKPGSGR